MNNKAIFGALSLDLKRVALGYHRGSNVMAERFFREALKRKNEIDLKTTKPYLKILLKKLENIQLQKEKEKIAEDALMYSTLFQNAAVNTGI